MRKKIFITSNVFYPSKNGGGPVKSLKNLVVAAQKYYDIYVLTYSSDLDESEQYKGIFENEWNEVLGVKVFYLNKNSKHKKIIIKELLDKISPSLIYCNSFFSPLTILTLLCVKHKKVMIAPRGEFSPSALNIKKIKKSVYLLYFRLFHLKKIKKWHATSNDEKKCIHQLFTNKKVINVPNIVIPNEINFINNKKVGNLDIVFLSRIVEMKNLKYVLYILNKIKNRTDKINMDIYGPCEDIKYWNECQELIKELPSNISVNYKGTVDNESVISTISYYDILFLPTKGENFGHVIFEAMSAGVLPLISDRTPWKNLDDKGIGWDISLEMQNEFIDVIEEVIMWGRDEYQIKLDNLKKYLNAYKYNNDLTEQLQNMFD